MQVRLTPEEQAMLRGERGDAKRVALEKIVELAEILGAEEPITCRPADLLEPELDKLRVECAEWMEQEEDVLTYAMFPKVAPKFFEARRNKKYGVDGAHSDSKKKVHPV